MKKRLSAFYIPVIIGFIFICSLLLSHISKVEAFTATPDSGDYTIGTKVTIELKAVLPDSNVNAVAIRLQASGIEIKNYTQPASADWIIVTNDCDDDKQYTSNEVCVSLAKSTPLTEGESLGTIEVVITSNENATLTKMQETAYSDGSKLYEDSGILTEYNKTEANGVADTEETTTEDKDLNLPLIIGSAVGAIVLLIVIFIIIKFSSRGGAKAKILLSLVGLTVLGGIGGYVALSLKEDQSVKDSSASECGGTNHYCASCDKCVPESQTCNDACPSCGGTNHYCTSCGKCGPESQTCNDICGGGGGSTPTPTQSGGSYTCYKCSNPGGDGNYCTTYQKSSACSSSDNCNGCQSGGGTTPTQGGTTPTSAPTNKSDFKSQSIPSEVVAGNNFQITIKYKNNGTTKWTKSGNYKLGLKTTDVWGVKEVELPSSEVAKNAETTFTITLKAPDTAGNYNLQWQMKKGSTYFGEKTTSVAVQVKAVEVSATPSSGAPALTVTCGGMDANGDGQITVLDLAAFVNIYGKNCNDSPFSATGCGGKDSDGNGTINIQDLAMLAFRIMALPDCSMSQ